MNKSEFIQELSERCKVSGREAGRIFNAFADILTDGLKQDKRVQLLGVGTFELKYKPTREATNPATGEAIVVPASETPVFKPSRVWKAGFND